MRNTTLGLVLGCAAALQARASDTPKASPAAPPRGQTITHAEDRAPATGMEKFFTGRVRIEPVWPAGTDINASGGSVTFEPGARSYWHTHPRGQYLVVTYGVGFTQEWGKPVQVMRAGDVVWCPPGVKHWHGATPTNAVTHLAVTGTVDGRNVTWMEEVTDAHYHAHPAYAQP